MQYLTLSSTDIIAIVMKQLYQHTYYLLRIRFLTGVANARLSTFSREYISLV